MKLYQIVPSHCNPSQIESMMVVASSASSAMRKAIDPTLVDTIYELAKFVLPETSVQEPTWWFDYNDRHTIVSTNEKFFGKHQAPLNITEIDMDSLDEPTVLQIVISK